jgi:hypothetical protein
MSRETPLASIRSARLGAGCAALLGFAILIGCGEDEPAASGGSGSGVDGGGGAGTGGGGDGGASIAPPPRVDGRFDDWSESHRIAVDPAGDATGAFDLTQLYAQSRGSELYLRFDVGAVKNLFAGPGVQGTFALLVDLPDARRLTIDFRRRRVSLSDSEAQLRWHDLRFLAGPSFGAREFEVRVDLAPLGVELGSTVALDFSGSDTLDAPVPFTFETPSPDPARRPFERAPSTRFRVANLNTWWSGLLGPTPQRQRIGRLVKAASADVYAFQEEYESTENQIAARLSELDPRGDGASWNVHKIADNVIASPSAVRPLPSSDDFHAAAIVEIPGSPVLVVSIHPTCCGWVGSPEDRTRIAQMKAVIQTVGALRSRSLGAALAPFADAPAVVVGDWNLVGSRTPLTLLEDELDLAYLQVPHLIGEQVFTWREPTSSFPPGLLDLVVHQATGLSPRGAFVLESAELNEAELAAMGLEPEDSLGSDHMLVVVDFE